MRKLLTFAGVAMVMVMLATAAFGQMYGFNGTNTPEVLTPEVRGYITELTVDTIAFVFRDDKYDGSIAPESDIDNVIALHNELQAQGKTLAVCFTLYTRDSNFNVGSGIFDLDELLNAGVFIYSIRFGNEEWAKVAGHGKKGGDFGLYWALCSQYLPALTERGIDRMIIPVERPSEELTWNNAAADKINSDSRFHPDYHPYWGPRQVPVVDSIGVEEELPVVNTSTYQPYHDWFYQSLYDQVLSYDLIGEIREWHNTYVPGKEWHITEVGPPTAVGHISNAIGFDATTDWFYNAIKAPDVKFVARFNGPSPTGTAIISPRAKKDITGGSAYVKRLGYHTLYNFLRHKDALVNPVITAPGTYTISIHNLTREQKSISDYFTASNLQVSSQSFTGIWGENYYSGSGTIEWISKDSPKAYEIGGPQTSDVVPALSYGYATVTLESIPVYGCTDATATNYNPDATVDNGTCTYPPPPVECYRKRWLFKTLPCKPATTNCNCSPTKF